MIESSPDHKNPFYDRVITHLSPGHIKSGDTDSITETSSNQQMLRALQIEINNLIPTIDMRLAMGKTEMVAKIRDQVKEMRNLMDEIAPLTQRVGSLLGKEIDPNLSLDDLEKLLNQSLDIPDQADPATLKQLNEFIQEIGDRQQNI